MTDRDHRTTPDDHPADPDPTPDTEQPRGDGVPRLVAVGLLADPGLAALLVDRLGEVLPERLRARVSDHVTWTVDTVQEPFEAMYPDSDALVEKAREHVRDTEWDLVVCVTDQPMRDGPGIVLADLHTADRVAVVSLPALGGLHLGRRLGKVVPAIVAYLAEQIDQPSRPDGITRLRQRLSSRTVYVRGPERPGSPNLHLVRPRRRAQPHLLAGMVRVNRPWQLLRGLSTALAGAMTGIAFGVLYSTIWALGTALGPLRLAAVTVAAIGTLTVWLIVAHELWERGPKPRGRPDPDTRLRNASTVVTVAAGAVAFFVAMFVVALAAVALVIPPTYLAGTLGHPVGVSDYLAIAVMASVLGTIAGAVGSGLEDDITVREATYGYRARERRQVVHDTAHDASPVHRHRK
ncbi:MULTISPECIES: hypothetical protein [Saccharothrix]|uniref:hypothetical protein n=1 Tax=Saccharothrix TaxID=2071 RepID=UPI00093A8CD4|nr:hypothetical protein [Saccharothrix sp. CB00851]OKI26369.1 hypothetical protein A6A25_32305 [Saccharothrix sp. CB00851]